MANRRTLTTNGLSVSNMILIFLNLVGIGVTIYLTNHYFNVHYPSQGLTDTSGCDFNSFFNCDAATFSPISSFKGVPLAIFGLAMHVIFLIGSLVGKESFESTNKSLSLLNAIGCLLLFVYSLVALGSLCPYCTVYYILSWAIFYMFWRKSDLPFASISPVPALVAFLTMGAFAGATYKIASGKIADQESIASQIIEQYYGLPNLGKPEFVSPFTIAKSFENIDDAPIWIAKFSDFQCPFCMRVAKQLETFAKKYAGKINIYYYPYPLSNLCNSNLKSSFHKHACQAARVAMCNPSKFHTVHDEIFANQNGIDAKFLGSLQASHGLNDCDSDQSKDLLSRLIRQGDAYKVKSTPTLIVNGVKIEGALPDVQFFKLFDEIIKRSEK